MENRCSKLAKVPPTNTLLSLESTAHYSCTDNVEITLKQATRHYTGVRICTMIFRVVEDNKGFPRPLDSRRPELDLFEDDTELHELEKEQLLEKADKLPSCTGG
jgi:hypothetical protein